MMPSVRHLRILLFFLGLTALFYAPQLLAQRTFPNGDFTHHFLPFSLFQKESILARYLPLWNPYTYSGHPFLADVQAAVFYPLSNLFILLEAPFSAIGTAAGRRLYFLQLEAAAHVALAGFFVYLLVQEVTRKQSAAFIAGCTFAFSGYLTGYPPQQLAVLRAAIWLPLILWLLYRAFAAPKLSRWWTAAAGAISIAFLAGHPQTFLHIGYVTVAWVLYLLWGCFRGGVGLPHPSPPQGEGTDCKKMEKRPSTHGPSPAGRLGGGHILGLATVITIALGLSAAQLLPSIEFTLESVRSDVSYEFVSGGFPLRDTWQMLLPWVFTQFSPLYVGVVGLGLAVCAFGLFERKTHREEGGRSQRRLVLFFLSITVVALLLSFGANGFLYRLFYLYAPGWEFFRGQERTAFVVALGLSILCGLGFSALPTMPLPRRRRLIALFTVLMIGAVYAFGLLWQFAGQSAISNGTYLFVAVLTLLLTMAFAVSLWLPGWDRRSETLLLGLLVGNLFVVNFWTNIDSFGPERKTILAPEMEGLQEAVGTPAGRQAGLPGRVYNEFRIYEDAGMRLQTEDVWGSSPLRLSGYAALFDQFPLDRMWQLTGVAHVLTWRAELPVPSKVLAEYPQSADTTYLHRLIEPFPRARVVHRTRIVDDEEAVRLLADHNFDLTHTALLAPSRGEVEFNNTTEIEPSIVSLTRLTPNALRIFVESPADGLLVIAENSIPGWQIENYQCVVNGSPCDGPTALTPPILRANLAFLGIPIQRGQTEFDLRYQPQSVRLGLQISGLTILVLVFFGLGRWDYKRRRG